MLNFCTLFNSMYLTRGLAMYYSLERQCKDFHLYIFAFDTPTYEALAALGLSKATIISLKDFENEALLAIKASRTVGEYCWTCTPSTIIYCIDTYGLPSCTYLDADLFFYADPTVLIDELSPDESVIITDHRYTPEYDQTATSGKYCVQFVYFKNDLKGRKVLDWWNEACLEWCFNRFEDNKFGDQKYLDDWCERFEGVHELQHLGGGVAPWNVQQYGFNTDQGIVKGREHTTNQVFDVVFYHFHNLRYCEMNTFFLGYYEFSSSALKSLYKPYIKELAYAKNRLSTIPGLERSHEKEEEIPRIRKSIRRMFKLHIMGRLNNYFTSKYLIK